MKSTVAIIGGGLAGLCAAKHLHRAGVDFVLIEREKRVGGRIRTEERDGFKLDRGFQVLLSAYPNARLELNYDNLGLHSFTAGALIRDGDRVAKIFDPLRDPSSLLSTLTSKVFSLADQILITKLSTALKTTSLTEIEQSEDASTLDYLRKLGFSERSIELFFKPFFGGVFLDTSLETSSRIFQFTYKMFSEGTACLPRNGMQAIPHEIATSLPKGTILCDTAVTKIIDNRIITKGGDEIVADQILIATDWHDASKLSERRLQSISNGTFCSYFAADASPYKEKCLYLDADATSPIQHLSVLTNVCPSYSRDGRALISVSSTTRTPPERTSALKAIRARLLDYFGDITCGWEHLESYWIPHALIHRPAFSNMHHSHPFLHFAGDYLTNSSINGALESGKIAAQKILFKLNQETQTVYGIHI